MVLLRGSVVAFNRPSRMTVIFSLVGRDMLTSAVALNSVIFNVSRFVGPAVGGSLIVFGGVGWTFAVAAVLFFIFTVTLHMISARVASPPARERHSIVAETLEGLRYMMLHRGIRIQMAILIVIGFLAKPLSDLLPGFVGEVFSRGPEGLAVLTGAYGFGAMAGAFWMVSRDKGVAGLTVISINSVMAVAAGILLFAAMPWFWVACPFVAVTGFAFIVQNVANQTLIQMSSEPAMRGRVISNHGLVQHGAPAIGALVMGIIADHIGLRAPVAAGAILCLGLWYWVWRQRKALATVLESEPATATAADQPAARHG
jgi:predicted MFS family arabinose efflux permease